MPKLGVPTPPVPGPTFGAQRPYALEKCFRKLNFDSENKIQFIERLQREERLSAITKSQLMEDIRYRWRLRSKTCIDIFGLLDKSDCRLAIENSGTKWFFRDIVNEPEALTMALNFYTKVEQIELIKKGEY